VPTFPSLTPTKNGITPIAEVYYGWLFSQGTVGGVTTSGYSSEANPFFDGQLTFSTTVTTGTQSPAFTATSALWSAVAAIFYVVGTPAVTTLSDSFPGTTLNSTKWAVVSGSPTVNNQLSMVQSTSYIEIASQIPYTLVGSVLTVKVIPPTSDNGSRETQLQFVSSGVGLSITVGDGNTISCWYYDSTGTRHNGPAPAHTGTVWLRLREVSGTVFWDYSNDGVTWTNAWSVVNPCPVNSAYVALLGGFWNVETAGQATVFQNLNILPAPSLAPGAQGVSGTGTSISAPSRATPVAQTLTRALASVTAGVGRVGPLQFMIPLYVYPTSGTFWSDLASTPANVAYVVANPASGPGSSVNSDYTTGINNLRTAGIKVLGYVDTADAAKGLTFPTAAVSDNFNRTENPVSNAGLWNTSTSPFAFGGFIKSNGTVGLSTAGSGAFGGSAIASTIALPLEMYVDIPVMATGTQYVMLGWFANLGSSPNGYIVLVNATNVQIARYTAGTPTTLMTIPLQVPSGDSVGMTITTGGLITAWHKSGGLWLPIGQITDTTYTAASFAFLGTNSTTANLDNFAAHSSGPAVEKQMDDWATWYSIDGYFMDNANNIAGSEPYYSAINAYAKGKNAAWITVNNYGTTMPASYYPTADIHMNTEETETQLAANFQPLQGWESSHPASHFAEAIYSCTRANLGSDLSLVLGRNAYYVWLAEDTLYQTEPSYWTSTLQALVYPAPPALLPSAASRAAGVVAGGGLGAGLGAVVAARATSAALATIRPTSSGLVGQSPPIYVPIPDTWVPLPGYWRALPGIVQAEWTYDALGNFYYLGTPGNPTATLCVDSVGNVRFYQGTLRPGQLVAGLP
jgi:hypothetical protein